MALAGICVSAASLLVTAVLVTLVVGSSNAHVEMAKRGRALREIATLRTAVGMYEAHNGQPPTTEQGLSALIQKPTRPPVPMNWQGPYLEGPLPKDPWGHDYVYRDGQAAGDDYSIVSYGADGREGREAENADIGPDPVN